MPWITTCSLKLSTAPDLPLPCAPASEQALVMELHSFDVRDPAELIEEVARREPLRDGDVLLVLVEDPSTAQRIVQIDRLEIDARIPHYLAARDLLADHVQAMPIPLRPERIRHTVVTVLARRGLTVFGGNEANWFSAWRYSNHLCSTFDGGMILVTEHGWRDFMTDWGDHYPRIEDVKPPGLVVPADDADLSA